MGKFRLLLLSLLLIVGGCRKKLCVWYCCPPNPEIIGKKWELVDVIETVSNNSGGVTTKSSYSEWKDLLGGDLIIEFRRKGGCRLHAYVKQTGELLYGSRENEPVLRYERCRGKINWRVEFNGSKEGFLVDSLPVLINTSYGVIYVKVPEKGVLYLQEGKFISGDCDVGGKGPLLVLKRIKQ